MESESERLNDRLCVVIAGAGNVASHIAEALAASPVCNLAAIASRDPAHAEALATSTGAKACRYCELAAYRPDVIIMSVADRAAADVVSAIGRIGDSVLALHTSGTLDKSVMASVSSRTGIFYPFQTFTKGFDVNMAEVPFFVETARESDVPVARRLAEAISDKVYDSDEEKRRHLHVAGVFTSNFVNVLLGVVDEELQRAGYPPEVAEPLLRQTIEKAGAIGSYAAQTGPAVRGDMAVMRSQMLTLDPVYREAYKVLSELIMQQHNSANEQDKL